MTGADPRLDNDNPPAPAEELERQIHFLQDPFGDEAHQREQERAVQYLLSHADQAHPRLLELLQSQQAANPFAIIEVLPRFGRPESVPVLAQILERGPQNASQAAAEALARHPLDSAQTMLLAALSLPAPEAVIAAADGLLSRGDLAACPALLQSSSHPDPLVRYHVIQAAGSLDCLAEDQLAAIARDDPDEDVKELANRLLQEKGE